MKKGLVSLDVGNTSTTMAFFAEGDDEPTFLTHFATEKNAAPERIREIYDAQFDRKDFIVTGAAMASVVPEIIDSWRDMFRTFYTIELHVVDHTSPLGVTLGYRDPSQLGPDRIANMEAAWRLHGGNVITVDIGTAVTFCVILEEGRFDGGLIAPGMDISRDALAARASRLPQVLLEWPERPAEKTTEASIRAGLLFGWSAMVEGVVAKLVAHYRRQFTVIVTGGHAPLLIPALPEHFVHEPLLTMKGIRVIHEGADQ